MRKQSNNRRAKVAIEHYQVQLRAKLLANRRLDSPSQIVLLLIRGGSASIEIDRFGGIIPSGVVV